MLKRRESETQAQPVTMDGAKDVTMRMMVGRADGAPNFAMRQFTVQPGGHTPRHRHNYEHEVYILEGSGTVEEDGADIAISAGDTLFVKPNVMHQFRNTSDAPLKFLCLVPVTFDCQGTRENTPGS